jgi:hypothetical protein
MSLHPCGAAKLVLRPFASLSPLERSILPIRNQHLAPDACRYETRQTPLMPHIAPNRKAKAQATIMRCFDILH